MKIATAASARGVGAEWNHVHHVQSHKGEDHLFTWLLCTELERSTREADPEGCELKDSLNYTLLDAA